MASNVSRRVTTPVSCNKDCGGGCPLEAVIEGGRLVAIRDNPLAGPFMHGCPRGHQMPRVLYSPDRLRVPLIGAGPRGSGQFREATWDEALALVATRLAEIRDKHGHLAILPLGGGGACRGALHNTGRLKSRFFNLFGGATYEVGSYSSQAANYATPFVLGTRPAGVDPATLQHSAQIILWGANLVDCRLGCEYTERVRQAKARGCEVIVIDPRRTATVRELGTWWVPVRPGTDTALMLALLYVLIQENLVDQAFVARYSVGYDPLRRNVLGLDHERVPKTPDWAAALCGTPADMIVELARRYAARKPTALIPGLSSQRTIGGEEAVRLGIALQVVTGNLGVLGGASGTRLWGRLPQPRMGALATLRPARSAQVPQYRWPDAILEGRRGGYPSDLHAIYNIGANYLVQGSDVRKNIRALQALDFSVCHDYFLTPTARYCDVVLPCTTFLERQDILFPSSNYLLFSNRAVESLYQARNDYDIFAELAERLGFGSAFSEGKGEEDWLREFVAHSEVPDYDEFRRTGIYMGADQERVGLADFVADPVANRLDTPSGLVELSSGSYASTGYPPFPTLRDMPPEEGLPLRLITPKSHWRTHSQNDNIPWYRERERQALWINPRDAAVRGISDGQPVLVRSRVGRVRIGARVTDDIMPGVVCLTEGAWPELDADGVDHAGSANVLTSTEPTLPSGGSRTHSTWVQVE